MGSTQMNRNQWLREVVKPQLGDVTTAIEVGVWRGEYSRIIMNSIEPLQFYGVDPYLLHDEYGDAPDPVEFANQTNLNELYMRVAGEFARNPYATLLREKGVDAAKQFDDNSLDFVYIDGDHSYDFVKNDIAAWYPKIMPGGILSGHDYTEGNPQKGHIYGVIKAVNEFVEEYDLELHTTDEEYATWWVTV
jgi:hypothetical protein